MLDAKDNARSVIPGSSVVIGFDMDGTIIRPKNGRTFPRDRYDWEWLYECVPTKLKALHASGAKIVIFTNQGIYPYIL